MRLLREWDEVRQREAWAHTSWVCAAIANTNPFRKEGAPAISPDDFNPFELAKKRKPEKQKSIRVPTSVLKGFFVKE